MGDRAIATDIDSVALLLARRNAEANELSLEAHLTEDPTRVGPADLVVCNFPTHAERAAADALIAALVRQAATARVLVVIHASLTNRYTTRFEGASGSVMHETTADHAVLGIRSAASPRQAAAGSSDGCRRARGRRPLGAHGDARQASWTEDRMTSNTSSGGSRHDVLEHELRAIR